MEYKELDQSVQNKNVCSVKIRLNTLNATDKLITMEIKPEYSL